MGHPGAVADPTKGKYRGLSTSLRSGRDDVLLSSGADLWSRRRALFARGFGLDDEGDELEEGSKDGLKPGKRNGRAARLALSRFIAYLHFQNTKRRLTNRHFGDAQ